VLYELADNAVWDSRDVRADECCFDNMKRVSDAGDDDLGVEIVILINGLDIGD